MEISFRKLQGKSFHNFKKALLKLCDENFTTAYLELHKFDAKPIENPWPHFELKIIPSAT